ncbi:hypothetical protein CB0940_03654 [Cercospora beticola]|uniref:Uncharacterized protein n=2 Tax=Cercospora beticola TaxID=122368 RepID=A0A2G5I6A8_CERBT|nr:hypothetical protein CB0940_03654 [Cercospora beticola]PIB00014.1 hypothetical protein CB0940_03654 [Cercospora beticola]
MRTLILYRLCSIPTMSISLMETHDYHRVPGHAGQERSTLEHGRFTDTAATDESLPLEEEQPRSSIQLDNAADDTHSVPDQLQQETSAAANEHVTANAATDARSAQGEDQIGPHFEADDATDREDSSKTTLMAKSSTSSQTWNRKALWLSVWWRASLAALFLIMATAASFITLAPYQGHPLPHWPYNITIGALLSVYSVVLRGTATFLLAEGLSHLKWRWFGKHERPLHDLSLHDEAAQGPIGAVTLLWRLRFLPSTWQWLGCLLIPVTLLVGPFTQQALQYVSCSVLADSSTPQYTIPRNSFFLSGAYRYDSFQLDLAQQVSINTGMYSPNHVDVKCETGNCTSKSTYSSIGFCARCKDISSRVSVESKGVPGGIGNATTSLSTGLTVNFTLQNVELATMGERPYDEETQYGSLDVLVGMLGDVYT